MSFAGQWTLEPRSGEVQENNAVSSEEVRCGGSGGEHPVLLFLLIVNGGIKRS